MKAGWEIGGQAGYHTQVQVLRIRTAEILPSWGPWFRAERPRKGAPFACMLKVPMDSQWPWGEKWG